MSKAVIRRSERIYGFLLKLYPKSYRQKFEEEMQYVFSETLKDAYINNREQGVIRLWSRTIIDTCKSLVIQHAENLIEGASMKTTNTDILMQNRVFIWIALATGLILLVPLLAMQFTDEVVWTLLDFATVGALLFCAGLVFVLAARKTHKYRAIIALVVAVAVLYIWAELAVGIFTTWGS
jgi:hypothetical protein